MKKFVTGIVAHVDAGKTTLSEALLYQGGAHRQLGRVDNGTALLDPEQIEQQRGITVFSHQAVATFPDLQLTLLDTPGHIDFAAQTEQVLPVLDYAILVVSATDGIQGSTRTLWRLLAQYQVPTFIFINKTDVVGANPTRVIKDLQTEFQAACLPFAADELDDQMEDIATSDDQALDEYLTNGTLRVATIQQLIANRKVFPVYQGAALKLTGVDELIAGLTKWTQAPATTSEEFGARVFKISHDDQGDRLTWLRVSGGILAAKTELLPGEKVNQIRTYNGSKFTLQPRVTAGDVCAVTGLTTTFPGQGLGTLTDRQLSAIQPVLTYAVVPQDVDPQTCLKVLRKLQDEDPHLNVQCSEHSQEIHVQIMGEVQLEILQQLIQERYGYSVSFQDGEILYQETITAPVEGVGHFEPLRHYAEVHLLMEPAPRGSGLTFAQDCSVDILKHNWQERIMTSLRSKEHRGVLIGAPLTDVKITLINGRGSIKHSVGGDFREATWRAVRQGLMMLKHQQACELLEPWYHFRLTVDSENVGRAINDIQMMHGDFQLQEPSDQQQMNIITGTAPVASMRDYATTVRTYTHGQGNLELSFAGYQPCYNADEVIAAANYVPTADLDNTPDSVFCAHGAGYPVKWDQVPVAAHVEYRTK
ncbi:elongation factor G [Limosilactobacillus caecicola]|uniref:elongation factor G n=1 Tax=Limosilactobacillus caecicola TaxID=2941332 RepID=UPI002040ED03|nr:TetM/TetW/TetO/TetS family tetracycline resistance ribosomal protection protein [Limosilactobacillus caecicola]